MSNNLCAALRTVVLLSAYAALGCLYMFHFLGPRTALACYTLSLAVRFSSITVSAWRCCTGSSRADIQFPMEKIFRPAPGPELLENVLILLILLENIPLSAVGPSNTTDDSTWPVWTELEFFPLTFRTLHTLTHFYVTSPPEPFTKSCMNAVTLLTFVQSVFYLLLTVNSYSIIALCVKLLNGSVALPSPSLISYGHDDDDSVYIAIIVFQLATVILLRLFWVIRAVTACWSMGSVPRGGTRKRASLRRYTYMYADSNAGQPYETSVPKEDDESSVTRRKTIYIGEQDV